MLRHVFTDFVQSLLDLLLDVPGKGYLLGLDIGFADVVESLGIYPWREFSIIKYVKIKSSIATLKKFENVFRLIFGFTNCFYAVEGL